jgi:hypothetical protein
MLYSSKNLYGYKLSASDGEIGQVKDFYFDDQSWLVRYVVADTGTWLSGRQVLLAPQAFGRIDSEAEILHVKLTRKRIEDSPSIETHRPVSRQHEAEYYRYYGWPSYWEAGGGMWGVAGLPLVGEPHPHHGHNQRDDVHLRSTKAVTGYHLEASDGAIGTVSGFMVDIRSWVVRDLVVETGHWYAGKEILVAPSRIDRISYEQSKVFVSLTLADIRRTPEHQIATAA